MQILGNVFYVFEWVVPCHLLNKNTLGEYIFVRKYFQGTYFCKLCLKNCKFRRRYFRDLRPKVNLAVTLMFIKHYLTLFWQFAWLDLIFQKRHFLALSQKYILLKIFSTKISCNIYNIYNRNLRNDARSMLREREREREREKQDRGNDSCHFLDQYFLPCVLCKHPTILFQNKNRIFQHKN